MAGNKTSPIRHPVVNWFREISILRCDSNGQSGINEIQCNGCTCNASCALNLISTFLFTLITSAEIIIYLLYLRLDALASDPNNTETTLGCMKHQQFGDIFSILEDKWETGQRYDYDVQCKYLMNDPLSRLCVVIIRFIVKRFK